MKRIIITGATSMLGTVLTEIAVKKGIEVYAIVQKNTPRMDRIVVSPIVHLIKSSLDNYGEIESLPSDCDVLYHFAWAGTAKATRDDPEIQEQNVKYALEAVKLARKSGCRRFVGAGSQAEYGPVYDRINEKTRFAPNSSYGIAKYAAGIMSRKLCEKYDMDHVWGRIFSVYGPRDNEGTMLEYAIRCWDNGDTPRFSAGMQLWNYLYETDAGEMFYRLGCNDVPSGSYFVANRDSCMLRRYIDILMKAYGKGAKAEFAKASDVPAPGLDVDMERTLNILKYEPKVSFEDGIMKMIKAKSKIIH